MYYILTAAVINYCKLVKKCDIPIQKKPLVKKGKAQKVQVPEQLKGLIPKYGQEFFYLVLLGIKE